MITDKQKSQCRGIVAREIRKGNLIRPKFCSVCKESGDIDAHHPDYNKPLEVVWKCTRCHLREHFSDNNGVMHILLNHKYHHLPRMKEEPCHSIGLFIEDKIEDNHQERTGAIDWESVLAELKPRERNIIRLRNGFDGEICTLEEIGQIYKVTKQAISLTEKEAINKLRKIIKGVV